MGNKIARKARAREAIAKWWWLMEKGGKEGGDTEGDVMHDAMQTLLLGERVKENFCRIMAITDFASNIAKF
uniref:Uncharacterized protein n=1 Tax=Leersia perrieri TaxID=77586 RepID=A0A0D9VUF8_9ORYZ